MSPVMSCTTISTPHLRPVASIIADGVLPRGATTIVRRNGSSIAIRKAPQIATLRRYAHLVSPPHAPSQQIAPCNLQQSP
ncbi:MAG: hypothetical protein DLM68_00995 [Hyphomicrobiales bacterium]|nr:MAG: hypothetical protein DLM68_00995 [Hyphomicrobiales bacterium]